MAPKLVQTSLPLVPLYSPPMMITRPSGKTAAPAVTREMALVIYPGFQVLSLALSTVFELANQATGHAAYRLTLYSTSGGLVRSSLGFAIQTERLPRRFPLVRSGVFPPPL